MYPKRHKKSTRIKERKRVSRLRNILVFDYSSLTEIAGGLIPLGILEKLFNAGWKIIICGVHKWTEMQLRTFARRHFSVFIGSPSTKELRTLGLGTKQRFFISSTLAKRKNVKAAGWQFIDDENFKSTRKYFQKGDYHWKVYKKPSLYRKHVGVVELFFKDKSGSLLDVGCGDGLILSRLNRNKNLDCFGIDVAPLAIKFALQHGISNCTVANVSEFSGKYDYIFAGDLFEHLRNPGSVLKRMHKWLPKGGILFSSIPIQTEQMGNDFHVFTQESIEKLFGNLFTIKSLKIRDDLKKMYIVAEKKKLSREPRKPPQRKPPQRKRKNSSMQLGNTAKE